MDLHQVKGEKMMEKNVTKNERIIRIVLGIVLGIMACFISSWSGWVRGVLGIVAIAFLGTAFVGY
jgi:uncharacterized membrane protein